MPGYTIIEFANLIKHADPKTYNLILDDIKRGTAFDIIIQKHNKQ